ncbi:MULTISPECIES: hypothetical protein [Amycolatopsis]|uniref:Uncharacterized protein n=1 Tax=Amycolatopsis bullii TaxID=941987 RepID=A0ABQ3KK53_9PSEU|nr:hypothetical protein [Amycolatopsis bullii]GHG32078.1 hypothetical protein GCM10017567_60310 [Amycolatopsis bullii]
MERMDEADDARVAFEARLSGLVGRRVLGVDYWDVHNFASEPVRWDYGSWHHAVMGVGLVTDAGPAAVTWTGTFYTYGVEVFDGPIEDHLALGDEGPERIGPGPASRWDRYLRAPIRGAAAYWERLEFGPGRRTDGSVIPAHAVDVPMAVRLDFAAGAVWFVAAIPDPPDGQRVFVGGDEIMVVFSPEKMREMGFGDTAFGQ